MIKLSHILKNISIITIKGDVQKYIREIKDDSRRIASGDIFVAIKGTQTDSHQYIHQVITKGAVSIVCEVLPENILPEITYIQVLSSTEALGIMAHHFYGDCSQKFKLIGVTGTNGKTTIATLLYQLFSKLGYKCGLISTIENKIGKETLCSTHTTPDSLHLHQIISNMYNAGCVYVFMECSSHAIEQNRIAGLEFAGAIFTNISHDHLDYHHTFENYIKAKKKFFDNISKNTFVLTNLDDKNGKIIVQNSIGKIYTYSLKSNSDFKIKILHNGIEGLHLNIDGKEVQCRMVGEFNAYNLLAVYATAVLLGEEKYQILLLLSNLREVRGRMEVLVSEKQKIMAIVDYAHTPDALENVLSNINKMSNKDEKIITVVGCGGNRDKSKRPIMGKVACKWSHRVVYTSDNPRHENPLTILEEMQMNLQISDRKKILIVEDRDMAIKIALTMATDNTIVLVAGKGHENYQIVGSKTLHFDDKETILKYFKILKK
ncbi:MAG: UDP-N-acetylmuramoyl-L-alanyl-D-glutamate--2,6-diaminopimelate ligase [Chitinophagaceae bacterium]